MDSVTRVLLTQTPVVYATDTVIGYTLGILGFRTLSSTVGALFLLVSTQFLVASTLRWLSLFHWRWANGYVGHTLSMKFFWKYTIKRGELRQFLRKFSRQFFCAFWE